MKSKAIAAVLAAVLIGAGVFSQQEKEPQILSSSGSQMPNLSPRQVSVSQVEGVYDRDRSEHDTGTCRTLAEDAAIVVLFADDDVSSWDAEAIVEANHRVEDAIAFLRDNAASYGIALELPIYTYFTDENRSIRYSGTIDTGGEKLDALQSIALNWGFESKQDLHSSLQRYTGMDQVAYFVLTNKDGYTYAQSLSHMSADVQDWCVPEYCIVSIRTVNGTTNPPVIYLHELLHTFGAQDFYRKEIGGTVYNDTRAQEAQRLCPGAVMLSGYIPLADSQISGFTAYCVGWLNALPKNYDTYAWWGGTQWDRIYLPEA